MGSVVLDASAVLALIHRETGHERVTPHLDGALISAVNYSEVLKKTTERGSNFAATRLFLKNLNLLVVPFDERQAAKAAEIWSAGRSYDLSFADRACLAVGLERAAAVVTADKRFDEVELSVKIKLIR